MTVGTSRHQSVVPVEMQNEYRCVRRGGVDFVERWHSTLGKLKFAPAADHAHLLAWRRALRLFPQHPQSIGE